MAKQQNPVKIIHAILVQKAVNRETTTYGELAPFVGLPTSGNHLANTMGGYLLEILRWCEARNQPHLTSIVVKAGVGSQSGIPGNGFWTAINQTELTNEERRLVTYAFQQAVYDYYDADLKDPHANLPMTAEIIKVLARGKPNVINITLDKDDPDHAATIQAIQQAYLGSRNAEVDIDLEKKTITLRANDVL